MKKNIHTVKILHFLAFLMHISLIFIAANSKPYSLMVNLTRWITNAYSAVGFHWSGRGAYLVSVGYFSAFLLNIVRRTVEGVVLGWPRYPSHDRTTFIRSWIRAFLYIAIVIAALGFFGEQYSKSLDPIDVLLIGVGTFIFGLIADVLDDAISSLIVFLSGDE